MRRRIALLVEVVLLVLIGIAMVMAVIALLSSMSLGENGEEGIHGSQPEDGQSGNSGYILPESDSRCYSKEELEKFSAWDLYIAHNEIYARHGREFERDDLATYFNSCTWYGPVYTPEEFAALPSPLNEYERENSEIIVELRRERNDPYL